MTDPIETYGLARRFGRTEAVVDLTLKVPEGSIYAFLGPNGAGKTTTIKLLMNLIEPTAGRAQVLGHDCARLRPEVLEQIGYVSENQRLPEWMTVEQLMAFCRPFYPTWDHELCHRLVRMFDLPAGRRLRTFSRGMIMKAAMVTALAYRRRLLLLDEPFGGLDPVVRDEIVEDMLELSGKGDWTIFVSSHDLSEIENLADRVGFLRGGRLIVSEDWASLTERFREMEVTLANGQDVPAARPEGWLHVERNQQVVRVVESHYQAEETERRIRAAFGEEARFSASPMSLRQIFVALARASDKGGRAS